MSSREENVDVRIAAFIFGHWHVFGDRSVFGRLFRYRGLCKGVNASNDAAPFTRAVLVGVE